MKLPCVDIRTPQEQCLHTVGVKLGEDERLGDNRCRDCRTCRFDNVRMNLSSLNIQFYKSFQDVMYYHEDTGEPIYSFPDDFVMSGAS